MKSAVLASLAVLLVLLAPAASAADDAVAEALATTKVNVDFAETRIQDAFGFLSSMSGVNIHLDPRVVAARDPKDLLVTVSADDISVGDLLRLVTRTHDLAYDVRWGGVFVATKERLAALPKKIELTPEAEAKNADLLKKLAKPVNVNFDETPVREALDFLATISGAKMLVEPAFAERADRTLISLRATKATVLDVLSVALLPAGLAPDFVNGVVVVRRPGTRNDWLRQDLEAAFLNIDFEETPLADVASFLAKASGVPIWLDPELAPRNPDEMAVTLRADRIAAKSALDLVTLTKGLAWDVRWGGVFVASAARLSALPVSVSTPENVTEDWQRKLLAALRSPVSFSFDGTTIAEALDFLRTVKGVNMVLDPKARELAGKGSLSLAVTGLPLEDALSLLLVPRGLTWELAHEVILVTPRD